MRMQRRPRSERGDWMRVSRETTRFVYFRVSRHLLRRVRQKRTEVLYLTRHLCETETQLRL